MSTRAWLLAATLLLGSAEGGEWGRAQAPVEAWLGGQAPQPAGLTLELAEWVEDGAFVPLSLALYGAEPPVALSLLRSGEEDPRIARLQVHHFQAPLRLSTRVRLPRSQQLIVLARDARGRVWRAAQRVEVLASSCLAPSIDDGLAGLGRLQAWAGGEQALELRSLLRHPMESGRRRAADGRLLPRRLAQGFEVRGAQGLLLEVEPFEGLAANPYWRLLLPLHSAPLRLRWTDADGVAYRKRLP